MKPAIVVCLFVVAGALGCGERHASKVLSYSPEFPAPGDVIRVSYDPVLSGSCLANSDSLELRVSCLDEGDGIVSAELPMSRRGRVWSCTIEPDRLMPEGASLIVFVVQDAGDPELSDRDASGNPWVIPFSSNGDLVRGAGYQMYCVYSGEAKLASPLLGCDERLARESISEELSKHPDHLLAKSAGWMIELFDSRDDSTRTDSLQTAIRSGLDSIFGDLMTQPNPDTMAAQIFSTYARIGHETGGDSVLAELRDRLPGSRLTEQCEYQAAFFPGDRAEKIQRLESIRVAYAGSNTAEAACTRLARLYSLDDGAWMKGLPIVLGEEPMSRSERYGWAYRLVQEGRPGEAATILLRIIEDARQEEWPGRGSDSFDEWRRAHERELRRYLLLQSDLLLRRDAVEEAEQVLSELRSELPSVVDDEVLEKHGELQAKLGRHRDALDTFERLAATAVPDSSALARWKEAYRHVHGSADGFGDRHAALREERLAAIRARLRRSAESRPAPEVVFVDSAGAEHALSEWSGKVIVIDFWATWCSPCMRSLPRLSEVIARFAEDDDVLFLPLNTWEKGTVEERIASIGETWAKVGVRLPVCLDVPRDEPTVFPAADQFHVVGIPTSLIVGRDRRVLFRGGGLFDETDVERFQEEIDFALSKEPVGS